MDQSTDDVICLGQSHLALVNEQQGDSLTNAITFKKDIAGHASLMAIGLSRQHVRVKCLSACGQDAHGQYIQQCLKNEQVDTSLFQQKAHQQTPIHFYHQNPDHYFTQDVVPNSSDDTPFVDDAQLSPDIFQNAKVLTVQGSDLFHPNRQTTIRRAIIAAKEKGCFVVLDIDLETALKGANRAEVKSSSQFLDKAQLACRTVLPLCDCVFIQCEDLMQLFAQNVYEKARESIQRHMNGFLIVENQARIEFYSANKITDSSQYFPINTKKQINYFVQKEAFLSGFIAGIVNAQSMDTCIEWGSASLYLAQQLPGVAQALPTTFDLQNLLQRKAKNQTKAQDLKTLHRASLRSQQHTPLYVLGFDHRQHLQTLFERFERDEQDISKLKALIARTILLLKQHNPNVGVVVDDTYGNKALKALSRTNTWLARPVERSGAFPLSFQQGNNVIKTLKHWPKGQIVKVLVVYHPDDLYADRLQQEANLKLLYEACLETEHELLIEVITPSNRVSTAKTFENIISRFYEVGIYPDWWKIPPQQDEKSWQNVCDAIMRHDHFCKGILLLCQQSNQAQLSQQFKLAKTFPIVKGFVVGRGIFHEPTESWLKGELTDDDFCLTLARDLKQVIQTWETVNSKIKPEQVTAY